MRSADENIAFLLYDQQYYSLSLNSLVSSISLLFQIFILSFILVLFSDSFTFLLKEFSAFIFCRSLIFFLYLFVSLFFSSSYFFSSLFSSNLSSCFIIILLYLYSPFILTYLHAKLLYKSKVSSYPNLFLLFFWDGERKRKIKQGSLMKYMVFFSSFKFSINLAQNTYRKTHLEDLLS